MTLRTKRYRNSAALLIFMRRITISNFSFEQSFRTQSRGIPSRGLTPKFESRDGWLGIRDWGLGVTSD